MPCAALEILIPLSKRSKVVLPVGIIWCREKRDEDCGITGSYSGEYEDGSLLGCSAVDRRLIAVMMEEVRTSET
jgi:hypothetical protein